MQTDNSPDDGSSIITISRPTWLGRASRRSVSSKEVEDAAEQIKGDPSYAKNGWTPELLAMYFKERREAQSDVVLRRRRARPTRTNGWHHPHRWRR